MVCLHQLHCCSSPPQTDFETRVVYRISFPGFHFQASTAVAVKRTDVHSIDCDHGLNRRFALLQVGALLSPLKAYQSIVYSTKCTLAPTFLKKEDPVFKLLIAFFLSHLQAFIKGIQGRFQPIFKQCKKIEVFQLICTPKRYK